MEKIIKGFENYSVSDTGIVRNIKTGKIKVGISNNAGNGYLYVDIYNNGKKSRKYIHRLVAVLKDRQSRTREFGWCYVEEIGEEV